MNRTNAIEVDATEHALSQALTFVEDTCKRRRVNAGIASETLALFEAVFRTVAREVSGTDARFEVSSISRFGHTDIKMMFPGKRFTVSAENASEDSYARTIETYSDKVSCSYRGGSNVVQISVSQSARAFMIPNFIAAAAAIIVGVVLACALDEGTRLQLVELWVAPLESLFTNAVLMLGAPMTLFSLLKNASDSFIVSERTSTSRRLFIASLCSSAVAIVLACAAAIVYVLAERHDAHKRPEHRRTGDVGDNADDGYGAQRLNKAGQPLQRRQPRNQVRRKLQEEGGRIARARRPALWASP